MSRTFPGSYKKLEMEAKPFYPPVWCISNINFVKKIHGVLELTENFIYNQKRKKKKNSFNIFLPIFFFHSVQSVSSVLY